MKTSLSLFSMQCVLLFFLPLMLLFSSVVFADDIKENLSVFDVQNEKQIADKFYLGVGVKKNYKKAVYWYEKSAQKGSMTGKRDLGLMYVNGHGVDINFIQAYKWLYLASIENYELAQKNLEQVAHHLNEKEIEFAKSEAIQWLKLTANTGEPNAQFHLGKLYKEGNDINKNNVKALKWIILSQKIFSDSSINIPEINRMQENLMEIMTTAEINHSTEMAFVWWDEKK